MPTPKVLVTKRVYPEAVDLLRQHCEVDYEETDLGLSPAELLRRSRGCRAVVAQLTDKFSADVLAQMPGVGIISNVAVGFDNNEPAVHPGLLRLPNVVLAPHIASASVETRRRMSLLAAENALAALQGRRPGNLLNSAAWEGRSIG